MKWRILLICAFIVFGGLATVYLSVPWLLQGRYRHLPFEHFFGMPLPASANDVHSDFSNGFDGGEFYCSAAMPETDFLGLMNKLQLEKHPEVLQKYACTLMAESSNNTWWLKNNAADTDTFFALRPDATHDSYISATYQNGRMYLRRSFW